MPFLDRGDSIPRRNLSISSGPEKGCHSELGLIPMLTNGIKMGGDNLDQCCKMEKSGRIWRSGKQFHNQVGQEDSRVHVTGPFVTLMENL